MWFVYILYSKKLNKRYVGYTNDLENRLVKHNSGQGAKYTRMSDDWEIIYAKEFSTKQEALSYEQMAKKNKRYREDFYREAGIL